MIIRYYKNSKTKRSVTPCEFVKINKESVEVGSIFCITCKYYNGDVGIGNITAIDCTFKNKKVKSEKKNCIWIMEKTIDGGKTWWAFCGTYFPTKKSCIFSTRDHEPFTKNSLHKIRPTKYISSK